MLPLHVLLAGSLMLRLSCLISMCYLLVMQSFVEDVVRVILLSASGIEPWQKMCYTVKVRGVILPKLIYNQHYLNNA